LVKQKRKKGRLVTECQRVNFERDVHHCLVLYVEREGYIEVRWVETTIR